MAVCLNTDSANRMFHILAHDKYYVDKSGMIEIMNARINTMNRYICITNPAASGRLRSRICLGHIMEDHIIQNHFSGI